MVKPSTLRLFVFTLWFAFLQSVAPLMHAHFEGDGQTNAVGLHMHLTKVSSSKSHAHANHAELQSTHQFIDATSIIGETGDRILSLDQAIASKKSVFVNNAQTWVKCALVLMLLGLSLTAVRSVVTRPKLQVLYARPFFVSTYALRAPPIA